MSMLSCSVIYWALLIINLHLVSFVSVHVLGELHFMADYGLVNGGVGVQVSVGSRIFSSTYCPDWIWGPSSILIYGYWGLFPLGVKRPRLEADHSPPSSAEVKEMWIYTSTPPYAFMA
jgi:hypothetical protein